MSFDYGAKVSSPKGSGYKEWPKNGNKTALVDADLIPYIIGFIVDKDRYEGALSENMPLELTSLFQEVKHIADSMINNWIEGAGCDSALFFLTYGETFRHYIAFSHPYKGGRLAEKPPFFHELKRYIYESRNALARDLYEADDLITMEMHKDNLVMQAEGVELGSEMHKDMAGVVAVTIDKDIAISPGIHYNPKTMAFTLVDEIGVLTPVLKDRELNDYRQCPMRKKQPVVGMYDVNDPTLDRFVKGAKAGQLKTKRVLFGKKTESKVADLKGTGLSFFYAQMMLGDKVDNYKGLEGKGPVFILNALGGCKTHRDLYYATLQAFKDHYGGDVVFRSYDGREAIVTPFQFMLEQGRLAWMLQTEGGIWRRNAPGPFSEFKI